MGKIVRNGIEFSSTSDTANNINYDNTLSGLSAVTAQEAIDEINGTVSNLNENLGAHFLNITLSETTAVAVCKYIRENVPTSELIKGYHFNAVVNGMDFFSGHIYSDGGSTWWGTVQQRTNSVENSTLYKYFSSGGADSVLPFKGVKVIPITVSGKPALNSAWTVDLGVEIKSFMWYTAGPAGTAWQCFGLGGGMLNAFYTQSTGQVYTLGYSISGTTIHFPAQPANAFMNGAQLYFYVE